MEYVSVFPFSLNNAGEIVILVRRDGDYYRDLGGNVYNQMSPIHSACHNLISHSNYLIVPSNIERLIKKKPISKDESIFREVIAKLLTLPNHMCIKNIANHFGYLYPVPFIDPEILNTTLENSSLHWIRISILFSVEEYQRFFSSFDLAILGQINTHLLKQSIVMCKEPAQRISHTFAIINLEEEVLWQFHLEALLISNVFQGAYRSKEVKFEFFESELPTSLELEKISCVIVVSWREKNFEQTYSMLEQVLGRKKVLAIGSAAVIVSQMKGGRVTNTENQLELVDIQATSEVANCAYLKKYQNVFENIENSHCYRYATKNLVEPPADSRVLVTSKSGPIVYEMENTLCVHANPEYTMPFVEGLLGNELISQNLLSEEGYEVAKKTWDNSFQLNFSLIRQICEAYILGS